MALSSFKGNRYCLKMHGRDHAALLNKTSIVVYVQLGPSRTTLAPARFKVLRHGSFIELIYFVAVNLEEDLAHQYEGP